MNIIEKINMFLERTDKREEEPSKFEKLILEYREKFNDDPPTEPSSFTEEEWCEILEECIRENKTLDELWGTDVLRGIVGEDNWFE